MAMQLVFVKYAYQLKCPRWLEMFLELSYVLSLLEASQGTISWSKSMAPIVTHLNQNRGIWKSETMR